MRDEAAKTSLLFKPAGQIAVFDALATAVQRGVPLGIAATRLNHIDWSMTNPMWRDVIIKASGTIDTGAESREVAANLIAYLVSGDKTPANVKDALVREYNRVRGYDFDAPLAGTSPEALPDPVTDATTAAARGTRKAPAAPGPFFS